jgi:hypothetical protein
MSETSKRVRIGCFSAFWGDTSLAARQLVESDAPRIDYLVGDYLAEITMVILARKQAARSEAYVAEFVGAVWKPLMKSLSERKIRIVTNAGGLDPRGLKSAIERACDVAKVTRPRIAAVFGDDLRGDAIDQLRRAGDLRPFAVLNEPEPMWADDQSPLSCNAYLGAFPIARALDAGAQIVVTGRCVDSAIVLGPLIHEFGWTATQYDRLSAGSLAGHIVECGAQATGGNFTDWRASNAGPLGWRHMGFPIAECAADGSFVLTKPRATGGLVSRLTVAEQLVYEIGDAASYILPDVICDWRNVELEQVGEHRVAVRGARGRAPPEQLKVCATVVDGFQAAAILLVPGDDAAERARAVGEAVCARANMALAQRGLPPLLETQIDALGAESLFGANATNTSTREVVLRIAARHASKQGVEQFVREVAPAATGMAPGITGVGGGQAHATPCVRVVSCLVPRRAVPVTIEVGDDGVRPVPWSDETSPARAYTIADARQDASPALPCAIGQQPTRRVPLHALCVARSGDKGDTANIGVVARDPRHFELIGELLSAQEVQRRMAHVLRGQVARYPMPGLSAYNFVCTRALGGAGGTSSLACDRQGKSYAQQLLCTQVDVPEQWLALKSNL